MIGPLLIAGFVLLYFYVWKRFQYFKNHGIAHEPGWFPFGSPSFMKALTGQIAIFGLPEYIYKKHPKEKVVGYYGFLGRPYLVIRDIEYAKKILIKDFDYFTDRNLNTEYVHEHTSKYFKNMLSVMTGSRWKSARNMLTPIFTSGKIKATMPIVNASGKCSSGLIRRLKIFCQLNLSRAY